MSFILLMLILILFLFVFHVPLRGKMNQEYVLLG